jgi:methylated-DNA-[protein]-cysteine S-methyltransferase
MIGITTLQSPVGPLTLAARERRVCLLHFDAPEAHVRATLARWYPCEQVMVDADPGGAATALGAYFAGRCDALDGLDVELNGTPFQRTVWSALRAVRSGTTCSYSELARRIGAPSAVRAVGAANGANPVAIIVPCHRVIGANGTLTGYGGGLDRKRWLLEHEAAQRGLFRA